MDKGSSEIVKLTERISKDPKSKLFVPLAEEYKKIGDVEMAVYVLTEGLKNNPGYVTARSILGRLLLDQGDLEGAQKELNEVIKVIPDNLLAQRKLGDICVLQNNPNGALTYYKTVLSLSPRDGEIASIISDIEAGHDVRSRLQQPKSQPVVAAEVKPPVTPVVKQEATQQPQKAPLQQAAQPTPPGTHSMAPTHPLEQPAGIETPKVASMPAPSSEQPSALKSFDATPAAPPSGEGAIEEPEEIFAVEPLEKEKPEEGPRATGSESPAEQKQPGASAPLAEEPAEMLFAPTEQIEEGSAKSASVVAEPDIFNEPAVEPAQSVTVEKPVMTEAVDAAMREEDSDARRTSVPAESPEKSDDFTTDTLAELYISQGFYEKAIDIYERMLIDNPNSRGLKDKLDTVKAMASAPVGEPEKPVGDVFAEPQVYSAEEGPIAEKKEIVPFPDSGKEIPARKPEGRSLAKADKEAEASPPSPELKTTQAKPLYTDFEPREYTPPNEGSQLVETKAMPEEEKAEKTRAATKSATAIRKDTIDRLEAWLKNIKKES